MTTSAQSGRQTPASSPRFKFNAPQWAAWSHWKDGATVVCPWGRGGGKTWFIVVCMLLLVSAWDYVARGAGLTGVRIVYIMPTLAQSKKTVLPVFERMLGSSFAFLRGSFNKVDYRVSFPGGSWIQFVSQEQREGLRGIRCDAIFADECDDIEIEFYDSVVTPWQSEPFSLRRKMLGGTPTRGRHGLLYRSHRRGVERVESHYSRKWTWRDFPRSVDQESTEAQRRLAVAEGWLPRFEREWECNFDSGEGLVFPMFDESFHVREPDHGAQWSEWLIGGDHGFSDPMVRLKIAIAGHGDDAIAWVVDEYYETGKAPTEVTAVDQSWVRTANIGRSRWYLDPSQPGVLKDLTRMGARVVPAVNDIEPGIYTVAKFVSKRTTNDGRSYSRLYVSPRCKNTIREFGHYRFKKERGMGDKFSDDIEDKNNHAMDALRYALHTRFGGPSGRRNDYGSGDFTAG